MKKTKFQPLKSWTMILISPSLWTICFVLVYVLDEAACGLDIWAPFGFLVQLMFILILFTFLVNIANALWGWRVWRSSRSNAADQAAENEHFIGLSGVIMGCLFAFLTVGMFGSVLALTPC